MDSLDLKLQDLAKLAKDVSSKEPDSKSWVWKLVAGLFLAISIIYLRWQLAQKSKELAAAKTELELQRIDAQAKAAQAKIDNANAEAKKAQEEAAKKLAEALDAEAQINKALEAHNERMKKLEQIKNFEELNKLAGIP